jgi:hypothetical protein
MVASAGGAPPPSASQCAFHLPGQSTSLPPGVQLCHRRHTLPVRGRVDRGCSRLPPCVASHGGVQREVSMGAACGQNSQSLVIAPCALQSVTAAGRPLPAGSRTPEDSEAAASSCRATSARPAGVSGGSVVVLCALATVRSAARTSTTSSAALVYTSALLRTTSPQCCSGSASSGCDCASPCSSCSGCGSATSVSVARDMARGSLQTSPASTASPAC